MPFAHSRNAAGVRHSLIDHLREVADLAQAFARPFGAADLAAYLGFWHDVGKFAPDWQDYLLASEADKGQRGGPDHKAAGCQLAMDARMDTLALLIQAHHGGLQSKPAFLTWFASHQARATTAVALAQQHLPTLLPEHPLAWPAFLAAEPDTARRKHSLEFFLRLLFSTLVDADFLSTEQHMAASKAELRGSTQDFQLLWERYEAYYHDLQQRVQDTPVNRIRQQLHTACLDQAATAPGLLQLPLQTGTGKTLTGMAVGLRHALHHGMQRVIVAVPYTSITTQTAAVYRAIFDHEADPAPSVLEHHSAAAWATTDDDSPASRWSRLASDNWDAPIIVTTTVQLFESLFAHQPSRCRKLHRLANSVIVLDEVQSLPVPLLTPILDALRELTTHYHTTVILSTATQPAFHALPIFQTVPARSLLPSPYPAELMVERVHYDRSHLAVPLAWAAVATAIAAEPQALVIVNTKQDAMDLLDLLPAAPHVFHLSTALCGAHRRTALDEIRRRLDDNLPCWVIATQVVEAGVDLDFPTVWRALAPLDALIQAAGRCNRSGLRPQGRVVIFLPETQRYPSKSYGAATKLTLGMFQRFPDRQPDDPTVLQAYFTMLYQLDTDAYAIQDARQQLNYPGVSERFRMIDGAAQSVIVPYGTPEQQATVARLCAQLQQPKVSPRAIFRQLAPYMVDLYTSFATKHHTLIKLIDERFPQLGIWKGGYDSDIRGILTHDLQIDTAVV